MDTAQTARTKPAPLTFNYRRFRSALELRGLGVEELARQARVSSRHVWFVLKGERRPSASLLGTIREALGPDGYRFAVGEVDTLRDATPTVEAKP